jgi:amidase
MVPLALGTQTVGSTIRPAAYCGIVGYKPGFGLINRAGLKFSAESFDTIGLMGRSVADVALLARVLAGVGSQGVRDVRGLRLGLCLGAFRGAASAAALTCLESSAERLRAAGAIVTEFEPLWADERLRDAHQTVMLHELARASLWEYQHHADRLSEPFRLNIERGLTIDTAACQASRRLIADCRLRMAAQSRSLDGVLTLAAPGEAPEGLASTGDSVFNRIWTALAGPCLSLPAGRGERGLPLAVQWVGFEGEDAATLAAAAAIEAVLAG